jgi:hypothetical protein
VFPCGARARTHWPESSVGNCAVPARNEPAPVALGEGANSRRQSVHLFVGGCSIRCPGTTTNFYREQHMHTTDGQRALACHLGLKVETIARRCPQRSRAACFIGQDDALVTCWKRNISSDTANAREAASGRTNRTEGRCRGSSVTLEPPCPGCYTNRGFKAGSGSISGNGSRACPPCHIPPHTRGQCRSTRRPQTRLSKQHRHAFK